MKRRILSVLLCAAMVVSMAVGCSSGDDGGSEEKKEDASTQEEGSDDSAKAGDVNGDGKIVVGYISKNIRLTSLTHSMLQSMITRKRHLTDLYLTEQSMTGQVFLTVRQMQTSRVTVQMSVLQRIVIM